MPCFDQGAHAPRVSEDEHVHVAESGEGHVYGP